MRNTFIGICIFSCLLSINAQDKITLKNGQELNVTILEKTDTKIKYKFSDSISSNTMFTTKLSNLKTIHYENGMVDLLATKNPRNKYRLGITVGVSDFLSPDESIITYGLDYLFTPKWSGEINIGRHTSENLYCSYGVKYWFASRFSDSGFSPYTGLFYFLRDDRFFLKIPLGLSYISKFGFQTSCQLYYIKLIQGYYYREKNWVDFELRVGWRFK